MIFFFTFKNVLLLNYGNNNIWTSHYLFTGIVYWSIKNGNHSLPCTKCVNLDTLHTVYRFVPAKETFFNLRHT